MNRSLFATCGLWMVVIAPLLAAPVTVGVEGQLEVVLPFAGLKAQAPSREAPATVRIASARPEEGKTRYDLRYIGAVPGKWDLRALLLPPAGIPVSDLPPMQVEVAGVLPPGPGGNLIAIPKGRIEAVGGYWGWMVAIAVAWVLVAIPVFRNRRTARSAVAPTLPTSLTLPERLRTMVQQAAAGKLDMAGQAELERMVLSHWSTELGIQSLTPSEVFSRLRSHPQAGPLLKALEEWLHRRPGEHSTDLSPLLAVYGTPGHEPREAGTP